MQIDLDSTTGTFKAQYTKDSITIGSKTYHHSLILTKDKILPWDVKELNNLGEDDVNTFLESGADIILLGTGQTLRFPSVQIYNMVQARNASLDTMSSPAALRTYSILISENRNVSAFIYLDSENANR